MKLDEDTHLFLLDLPDGIVPKARARVTKNGTFHSRPYVRSQSELSWMLRRQHHTPKIQGGTWRVQIFLEGKQRRGGDADNIFGSVADALQKADVLDKDNLVRIPSIGFQFRHTKRSPRAILKLQRWSPVQWPDFDSIFEMHL